MKLKMTNQIVTNVSNQQIDYRIYSRISRLAYKSKCLFRPIFCSKIENPRIGRIEKTMIYSHYEAS
jgi:hypothetical protein